VVSEREYVGARREQSLSEARREADAVRRVLAVDDAEINVELVAQAAEPLLERASARRPKDIRDEEELQEESVAAGWTSSATWLPASFV
jgi:hypothetical protein